MLGNESRGIPEEILVQHPGACIRIPMWGDIRSLNLANSAAIILYEALRQNGFEHMNKLGKLHRLSWSSWCSLHKITTGLSYHWITNGTKAPVLYLKLLPNGYVRAIHGDSPKCIGASKTHAQLVMAWLRECVSTKQSVTFRTCGTCKNTGIAV